MGPLVSYYEQVREVVAAVQVTSAIGYRWFGVPSPALPRAMRQSLTAAAARSYLLHTLQTQLYSDFYCQGQAVAGRTRETEPALVGLTPFVEELSRANSGSGYWERGWEVLATENGFVSARKRGLELSARLEDCLAGEGEQPAPRAVISLRFPRELISLSPGFYIATSDAESFGEAQFLGLVRLYWNVTPPGAAELMRHATVMLNMAGVPFRLKVLNNPALYTRCDAAILYLNKSQYAPAVSVIEEIYRRVSLHVRHRVPALTKPLAHGLGLAEDPEQGESFGMHRSRILAEGIIRAAEGRANLVSARLRIVESRFVEEGLDLAKPFLNAGSADSYPLLQPQHSIVQRSGAGVRPSRVQVPQDSYDSSAFFRTSIGIGRRICQEALWHEERCNWIGAEVVEGDSSASYSRLEYSALGPNLYGGTAGIALFLAELYSVSRDLDLRRTALGAIRQALSSLESHAFSTASDRLGLYTGWPGILMAAARVARLVSNEELLERVYQIMATCKPELGRENTYEPDLLTGIAGAAVALIELHDTLQTSMPLEFAIECGDSLLRQVEVGEAGYSWRGPGPRKHPGLTGFSHGAAGVGYALLKLFCVTGDASYRVAAEMAFRYERYWFDPECNSWPDLREYSGRRRPRGHVPLPAATSWCHGAPGIALSRVYAHRILGDEMYKNEAGIALDVTRNTTEQLQLLGSGGFSLCHGLAGNAEILNIGRSASMAADCAFDELTLEIAARGIRDYAIQNHDWPQGIPGGETPGLMLGLAGIGYFYLRLSNPSTPSILMI